MAVEFRDYYRILGVERTASDEDIRKAFRKLARQYHPDVAKDKKTAEEKFKEINEAYEVLSDPGKRKKYDELGANWKQGAEFRPPPGWQQRTWRSGTGQEQAGDFEFHFGGTGFSDFFEQFFGSTGGGRRGAGFGGAFQESSQRGQDIEADIMVTLEEALSGSVRPVSLRRDAACDRCGGNGEIKGRTCPQCHGSGRMGKVENYQVKIPAGVREGQRLRLAGRGEPGFGRGAAGDLLLRVRFAKHPDFRVDGDDLLCDLDLAPWEAVLGAQVSVTTLNGRVSIRIPAGAQRGQKLRIRGQGLQRREGGRGDLFVVLDIQVPDRVGAGERALWEQLAKESRFNPRD
ncbi:MAG TPA: J domain-containing protein [Candidatus Angelobacter sp.]|nr:J domain-containing protein [Candidatus Angelobacter sp.]